MTPWGDREFFRIFFWIATVAAVEVTVIQFFLKVSPLIHALLLIIWIPWSFTATLWWNDRQNQSEEFNRVTNNKEPYA